MSNSLKWNTNTTVYKTYTSTPTFVSTFYNPAKLIDYLPIKHLKITREITTSWFVNNSYEIPIPYSNHVVQQIQITNEIGVYYNSYQLDELPNNSLYTLFSGILNIERSPK